MKGIILNIALVLLLVTGTASAQEKGERLNVARGQIENLDLVNRTVVIAGVKYQLSWEELQVSSNGEEVLIEVDIAEGDFVEVQYETLTEPNRLVIKKMTK